MTTTATTSTTEQRSTTGPASTTTTTSTTTTSTTRTIWKTDRLPPDLLVLGLGSNVGDRWANLAWAVARLAECFGPLDVAPCYASEALSPIRQPDFLNTVVIGRLPTAEPAWVPRRVLDLAKRLETEAGRRPGPRDGPRPLDIDLLLLGPGSVSEGDLASGAAGLWPGPVSVPHPRLRQRRFVLAPLADLAPDLQLPPDGRTVRDVLADLGPHQRAERLGPAAVRQR